jgi:DNA polymerase III subunit beta
MKFVIATQEMNYLINKCQNAVSQKSTIPVLANFMIEAKDGRITITATDLTVGVRCFTEAKILQEGATTVPAKKFASLLKELTATNLEFSTNSHHLTEIIAETSHFKLNGMGCDEFPDLPTLENAMEITIPQEKLREMFFCTSFAVSKEDNRYTLTGVFLHINQGKARFVGTDGKRLSRTQLDVEVDRSLSGEYIIPLKAVEEMLKSLDDDAGNAVLLLTADKMALKTENTLLVTKLLSGEYPDINRFIPERTETTVALHREELMTLLKQVSLFTAEANQSVKFSFSNGELKLSANTMEIGEGKVSMPVNYYGGDLSIAFNPEYFLDILRHSKGETVSIGITDSFNPGVITDTEGKEVSLPSATPLYVIMPMRLS